MATLRAVDVRAPEGGLAREESSSGEASPLSVLPPTDAFDELNLTRPGVSWCRYSTDAYVQLPAFVKPLLHMAHLHKILVVGLPSMSPSVGLAGFRDLVPKKIRKACPFTCVIDFPGREERGFVEVPNFVEVFTMDVTPYTGEKDFLKKALRANARRQWLKRVERLASRSDLAMRIEVMNSSSATVSGAAQEELIECLWRLYVMTGEKNGLVIFSKRNFVELHQSVPGMRVSIVYEPATGRLLAFGSAFRYGDVLLPQWVGIDYSHDAARACNLYYNVLQEHVRFALEEPTIRSVDMGACHRTPKMSMGFSPRAVSCYIRCPEFMRPMMRAAIHKYFNPQDLMVDP